MYCKFRDKLVYKELCIVNSHNINIIKHWYFPFEELPYVKIDSFFPPDIMHDMIESIIPCTLRNIIITLI